MLMLVVIHLLTIVAGAVRTHTTLLVAHLFLAGYLKLVCELMQKELEQISCQTS